MVMEMLELKVRWKERSNGNYKWSLQELMKKRIVYIGIVLFLILAIEIVWEPFKRKTYYIPIPTKLSIGNIPLIEVDIQDTKYSLKMDLGSKFQLSLSKCILNQLNKKNAGMLLSRDMLGNAYETPAYLIPKIKIGDFSYVDILANEESDDFVLNTIFWMDTNKSKDPFEDQTGTIGRGLLEKRNLLLDFYNSIVFISNDIKRLKKAGYHLEDFKKCFFDIGRTGLILTINTDMGEIRFSLDTGSTVSFIRPSFAPNFTSERKKYGLLFITTSIFEIAGKDFGNMNLYLQNITPELNEIDGILGMDFLKNHIVYIDYKDKVVYIGDSTLGLQESKKM
jgi:hypothetical protein